MRLNKKIQGVKYRELLGGFNVFTTREIYDKAVDCLYLMYQIDKGYTYKYIEQLREILNKKMANKPELRLPLKRTYKLTARDYFEDYCIFIEWEREVKKRFYLPRRKQLQPIVEQLQRLADDEIDLLAISLPPGIGKTTLALFFITWLAGKNPNETILTGSHSTSILSGMYSECQRIISGGEYLWREAFPEVALVNTNAKDLRLDLDTRKRFETLEFASIGSGNAGKVRATQLLYCDDLISDIQEALNIEQLDKRWMQYATDYSQRKQGDKVKELHIATRWSVHDIIGRLEIMNENNPRAVFLKYSALDENDESNFDYPFGVGFSTEFYHNQRNVMDDASWRALYMNEPIEREGLLYPADELRYYFELPDGEPDAIISVCDTKDQGDDYCVMPIAFKYGDDLYIEHILCENYNPKYVEPNLVKALLEYNVQMSRFESNSAGGKVAEKIQEMVKAKGGRCKITTKYSTQNKETVIIVNSPFVIEHCLFKHESKRDKEYQIAMKMLCGYTMSGRNKHDDVPDAFSRLALFTKTTISPTIEIRQRFF